MPLTDEQAAEIEAQREAVHTTRRATVPALEAMLYQALPVLDHGFVRVIDYMGDDGAVVQAARVIQSWSSRKCIRPVSVRQGTDRSTLTVNGA